MNRKKVFSLLTICMLCGIGFVSILFLSSERGLHRDNSFIRRFPGHPAIKADQLDLKFNSYYIAGADKGNIYLGNSTAPLHMLIVDTTLQKRDTVRLAIDMDTLPFRSLQLKVIPPHFFIADGTLPYVGRGNTQQWKAFSALKTPTFFSKMVPVDSTNLIIRSIDSKNMENIIGKINLADSAKVTFSNNLLKKQVDGIFDTDGVLSYNKQLDKIMYSYFYRNQYIVANNDLKLDHFGKTIDTFSKAQIKVGSIASKGQKKMAAPATIVNKYSSTYSNYLFVNSNLVGRHESTKVWEQASIIDVYDITQNTYEFSFYIYNIGKNKLRAFTVLNDKFIGLIGDHIVTYNLNNKRFKNLLL